MPVASVVASLRRICLSRCTEIFISSSRVKSGMSELQFTQQVNIVTGKMEWKAQNVDEHDYFRDIATSSYADMLHDTERNQLYYKAIRIAVKQIHSRGMKAKVLDIGTGTGLLSMMAATAGADIITAIEVFKPMAQVADKVTKLNGFKNIKVINKHSTEVEVGEDKDMQERANILVTELFDTELIGEGALEAYHHAHENLMEEDCIAVPHSATTYVQLVESDMMHSWHALKSIQVERSDGTSVTIEPDPRMEECPGVPAVHDIQLSQVNRNQFKELTSAVKVFTFEWGSRELSPAARNCTVETVALASGTAQVALSWWTLSMDENGEVILSTAPYWYHPTPDNMQWRDHWIQSVYFLPHPFQVNAEETVQISAFHDAYSLWFDGATGKCKTMLKTERPVCHYQPRMLWSRPRLGMLNDPKRNEAFNKVLKKLKFGAVENDVAVCISDATLLPLLVVGSCGGHGHIYSLENDSIAQRGIESLVKHNNKSDSITVVTEFAKDSGEDLLPQGGVNLFVGEPFFNPSILPWHNLRFWYARTDLDKYLHADATILPLRAHLKIVAVHFKDLWKIRAPVGNVEGFDVSIMDKMISQALEKQVYMLPEPHALWEYPCSLMSSVVSSMTFDFTKPVPSKGIVSLGKILLDKTPHAGEVCHGLVLWLDYDLDEEVTISTGLICNNLLESSSMWNMHHKQGVAFLRQPIMRTKNSKIGYELAFIPESGDINMKFNPES